MSTPSERAKAPRRRARPASKAAKVTRAERNIRWIERYCRVPEGRHVGRALLLRGWQRDCIRKIYDNPAGTRVAIISFGRKNGKTALAACLLLLHLVGPEAVQNGQCVSAAQSRDQAALCFKLCAKMIRLNSELSDQIDIRDSIKELHCTELGTLYKALSAEAATAYGLSPVFVIHDELGQVKGPTSELYDAVETATGAHDRPLSVIISTQAATDADLLSVLIDDAITGEDPTTTLELFTCPMSFEDIYSDEALRMANPAFGDFLNDKEARKMANSAKRMPSREPAYRNLILNQRVDATTPFLPRALWDPCRGEPADEFTGPVYIGLDLSDVNDLTARVAISPIDGVWHVQPKFWLPSYGLRARAKRDRVPYDVWHKDGYLETTPGKTIRYEWVAKQLKADFERWEVALVAFDRWNMKHLRPWLQKAGFTPDELERFVEFGQGYQSMSPALRTLEEDFLEENIRHGDHPVLKMCAVNAVAQTDPAGNRKLAKNKSSGRIDGMVALAMARGVAGEADAGEDEYVEGGVIWI